jgi:hypothetical protein
VAGSRYRPHKSSPARAPCIQSGLRFFASRRPLPQLCCCLLSPRPVTVKIAETPTRLQAQHAASRLGAVRSGGRESRRGTDTRRSRRHECSFWISLLPRKIIANVPPAPPSKSGRQPLCSVGVSRMPVSPPYPWSTPYTDGPSPRPARVNVTCVPGAPLTMPSCSFAHAPDSTEDTTGPQVVTACAALWRFFIKG